jgi:two-component system sensor histidine kinase KdpD
MTDQARLLLALEAITEIAGRRTLTYAAKLQVILETIAQYMQVHKSSIMLLKGRTTLEVAATTNPAIMGVRQQVDADSPAAWVVRNKKPLYVESSRQPACGAQRYSHYRGEAFYCVPLLDHGRVLGVINVTEKIGSDAFSTQDRDILFHITSQIIIALENHRLAATLQKKQKELQQKNLRLRRLQQVQNDFFNMLIHDLKGPLSEIVANLDILAYTLQGEPLEFVETAQSGCNTLYSMVSNLLDVSRMEEGRLPLLYESLEPRALIEEALAGLLVSVRSRGLRFREAYPVDADDTVQGDRGVLIRVLHNLLTNAIRHSPAGAAIDIGYRRKQNGLLEFFVGDHGPGIPEADRTVIFDKYRQLDRQAHGGDCTAGLGLAFCKMAVQAHGGAIGVDAPEGEGSRFYFVLPAAGRTGC